MKRFFSSKRLLTATFFLSILVIAPLQVMAEKVPFHGTATLGPCTVTVDGFYDTETGKVYGVASFSGGPPCRTGKDWFGAISTANPPRMNPKKLYVRFDTDNLREVRSATWLGPDKEKVEQLSNKELNEQFLEGVRKAAAKGNTKKKR